MWYWCGCGVVVRWWCVVVVMVVVCASGVWGEVVLGGDGGDVFGGSGCGSV